MESPLCRYAGNLETTRLISRAAQWVSNGQAYRVYNKGIGYLVYSAKMTLARRTQLRLAIDKNEM
jgi:hypothetical protein